jgi:hypothetical protein
LLRQTQRDGELTLKTLPGGGGVASLAGVKVSDNQGEPSKSGIVTRCFGVLTRQLCRAPRTRSGTEHFRLQSLPRTFGVSDADDETGSKGAVSVANSMMYDGSVMTAIFFIVENAEKGAWP